MCHKSWNYMKPKKFLPTVTICAKKKKARIIKNLFQYTLYALFTHITCAVVTCVSIQIICAEKEKRAICHKSWNYIKMKKFLPTVKMRAKKKSASSKTLPVHFITVFYVHNLRRRNMCFNSNNLRRKRKTRNVSQILKLCETKKKFTRCDDAR